MRLSALGDVALALPAVRRIRDHWPECELTWVLGKPAAELMRGLEGVRLLPVDKPRGLTGWIRLGRSLRKEHYDVLLAAQASARANLLYPWILARRKIGFDRRRARDGHRWFVREAIPRADEHLLDGFLAFVHSLGVPECVANQLDLSLPLSPQDHAAADELLSRVSIPRNAPFAAVHPSASKAERTWTVAGYREAARHLRQRHGLRVVITGGGGAKERALAEAVAAEAGDGCVSLAGSTTPRQLAALLAKARLLVAPDTGPVHFARASSTPVVGLYAVARAELSGPYKALAYTVDAWPRAVRACGRDPLSTDWHWRAHQLPSGANAMTLIQAEEVLSAIDRCLASQ